MGVLKDMTIIQGDNAGPHTEGTFHADMLEACKAASRASSKNARWMWSSQAPHMPHGNACDLAIFPSMSRRAEHCARKRFRQKMLELDEIDACVQEAWKEMQLSVIASSFITATV